MNDIERRSAALDAFKQVDPEGTGGVYLTAIAEQVAQADEGFMRRYNLMTKVLGFVGVKRPGTNLGFAYLPRLYPATIHLEQSGHIDSDWERLAEGAARQPRRVYRYLGAASLDQQG
jgi:hypothetical protein